MPLPTTAADWGPEITRNVAASNTYANTYRLSAEANALYNFHRCVNFNPTLTLSTDNGASWGTARLLIGTGAGGIRPYPRYCSNGVDRVDLISTECHPRDVANSVYHMYNPPVRFTKPTEPSSNPSPTYRSTKTPASAAACSTPTPRRRGAPGRAPTTGSSPDAAGPGTSTTARTAHRSRFSKCSATIKTLTTGKRSHLLLLRTLDRRQVGTSLYRARRQTDLRGGGRLRRRQVPRLGGSARRLFLHQHRHPAGRKPH